jgi:hypothetical protein
VIDAVRVWLEPMVDELERRDDGPCVWDFMIQGSVPYEEFGDDPLALFVNNEMSADGSTAGFFAIDWLRVGQLIREHLGWSDYPPFPKEES